MTPLRWCGLGLATVLVMGVGPSVAHADAAGPSDFRTEVESITPPVDGLAVTIEGGDAFVRLQAPAGQEVVVHGYQGEPYLRFATDGTVSQNRRSPATYLNEQRYGTDRTPPDADADAAPVWDDIADDGVWAWHDHRSHWMSTVPPIGLQPGQALPAQVIPIDVDGHAVEISVVTRLVASPSWVPVAVGALLGVVMAAAGWLLGATAATFVTGSLSAMALAAGVAQFRSLPAETGPLVTWWLMPAVAFGCAIAARVAKRSPLAQWGLLALAALQLLVWSVRRRASLDRPVLPTDLTPWVDRSVTSLSIVAAAILLIAAARSLTRHRVS